jgi:hypothetical protein
MKAFKCLVRDIVIGLEAVGVVNQLNRPYIASDGLNLVRKLNLIMSGIHARR